ncbi:hypothetical protein H696_03658 [Fonticula alba]|uniref:Serine hydrolase domain-containing protein n=1 Tax=Fonticula alba TaxID=691883 RepID=A0A058Z7E8_FONAL|nr:hypothetical protein H696_03658 [Fonticula alba]KCV70200.1 hypothetical protein H696_03658 [Fonticula alba]|eukprot:XP_009495806.1 hypothetical protein H696_03658 [Fonticula alba]
MPEETSAFRETLSLVDPSEEFHVDSSLSLEMTPALRAAIAGTQPLRVLCLHGFLQNGATLSQKTGRLRKAIKKVANFEFVDSPVLFTAEELAADEVLKNSQVLDTSDPDTLRSWWRMDTQRLVYHSFDETLANLEQVFREQGPFDGVFGFSQGAAMGALLAHLKSKGGPDRSGLPWLADLRFAILVSGFRARDPSLRYLFDTPVDFPSLHIIGEGDRIVAPSRSVTLSETFLQPEVLSHQGKHFVPTDKQTCEVVLTFLSHMLAEKTARQADAIEAAETTAAPQPAST